MRNGLSAFAFFVLFFLNNSFSHSATFTVNSALDDVDVTPGDGVCAIAAGQCTLRAAVQEANSLAGADTIVLPAGTYPLTLAGAGEDAAASGDLDIIDNVTINGGDVTTAADTIIDAGGLNGTLQDRVFDIVGLADQPISAVFAGLTIQGGYQAVGANGGGGICNHCGASNVTAVSVLPSLRLSFVTVQDNYSFSAGAGISNHGTLAIDDSIISANYTPWGSPTTGPTGFGGGLGGGIMNWGGTVSLLRSTLSDNYAQSGGGLYNQDTALSGIVLITDSTINANFSDMGGGIFNVAIGEFNFPNRTVGTVGLTINRTTIGENDARIDGGGIYNLGLGTVSLTNSTVTLNRTGGGGGFGSFPNRGGGIYNGGRLLDVLNSTIAGNQSAATRVSAAATDGSRGGDELFLNTTNAGGNPGTTIPMVVNLQNSIIGDSVNTIDNCNGPMGYGDLIVGANNIESGSTCGSPGINVLNADPLLGDLAVNGGFTKTKAIFVGSPALNAGNMCPLADQRGISRDVVCDLGAYEGSIAGAPPPVTAPVNTAPLARNGVLALMAGSTANGVLVAIDNERDPLTYQVVANPSQGQVTLTNSMTGAYTYTANANASGNDSFTFLANDGQLDSNIATVLITITVQPIANTPPVATTGSVTVAPGATVSSTLSAIDADGDALTYRVITNGSQGMVTISNAANGTFSYAANATANGSDSFTFVANDGQVDSNVAIVNVAIVVPNTPPSAGDGTLSVAAGATATGTLIGSDPDANTTLLFSVVNDARKGVLTITDSATGAYSYIASANTTGSDSFTFKVNDGLTDSNLGTVIITLTAGNTPPSAGDGTLSVRTGTLVTGRLPANDVDGDTLLFTLVSDASQGSVQITDARSGAFAYTSNGGTTGTDSFLFQVSDGLSESNVASIGVTIAPMGGGATIFNNTPPVVRDITIQVRGGQAVGQLPVFDQEGGPLVFNVIGSGAEQGKLSLDPATGQFSYSATAAASVIDSFKYVATDRFSTSNAGVVKLVFPTDANSPPSDNPQAVQSDSSSGGGGGIGWFFLLLGAIGLVGFHGRLRQ